MPPFLTMEGITMSPATRSAIAGTCSIIRQALITIEAIIACEDQTQTRAVNVTRQNEMTSGDELKMTTDQEDKAIAALYGLE